MLKRMVYTAVLGIFLVTASGCAFLGVAASAAAAYGIYMATKK